MLPVLALVTLAVLAWALWLQRRDTRRWIVWVGRGQLLAAATCAGASLWQLHAAKLALAHTAPAERATQLAMGVTSAMHTMAAGFVCVGLAGATLAVAAATTKRAVRRASAQKTTL